MPDEQTAAKLLRQMGKTSCVIVVPVGKSQRADLSQIKPHGLRVLPINVRIPKIKKELFVSVLQKIAYRGLTQEILVDIGVVVCQNRQLHAEGSVFFSPTIFP